MSCRGSNPKSFSIVQGILVLLKTLFSFNGVSASELDGDEDDIEPRRDEDEEPTESLRFSSSRCANILALNCLNWSFVAFS